MRIVQAADPHQWASFFFDPMFLCQLSPLYAHSGDNVIALGLDDAVFLDCYFNCYHFVMSWPFPLGRIDINLRG